MEKTENPYSSDFRPERGWWHWGYENGKLEADEYAAPIHDTPSWEAWAAGVAASIKDRINAEAEEARKKYESTGVHPNQAAMNALDAEKAQRHLAPVGWGGAPKKRFEDTFRLSTAVKRAYGLDPSGDFTSEALHTAPPSPEREHSDPNAGMYADFVPSGNIGDVNSTARGTGARFNAGKAKLQYVPMGVLRRVVNPEQGSDLYMTALQIESFESRQSDHGAALALAHVPEEHRWFSTGEQFDFGAKKYAAWNWTKGMSWSVPLACFKRHWLALARGEEIDPESGVSHWGAIGCNLVMLVHYVDNYREGDDRPPAEVFGGGK